MFGGGSCPSMQKIHVFYVIFVKHKILEGNKRTCDHFNWCFHVSLCEYKCLSLCLHEGMDCIHSCSLVINARWYRSWKLCSVRTMPWKPSYYIPRCGLVPWRLRRGWWNDRNTGIHCITVVCRGMLQACTITINISSVHDLKWPAWQLADVTKNISSSYQLTWVTVLVQWSEI